MTDRDWHFSRYAFLNGKRILHVDDRGHVFGKDSTARAVLENIFLKGLPNCILSAACNELEPLGWEYFRTYDWVDLASDFWMGAAKFLRNTVRLRGEMGRVVRLMRIPKNRSRLKSARSDIHEAISEMDADACESEAQSSEERSCRVAGVLLAIAAEAFINQFSMLRLSPRNRPNIRSLSPVNKWARICNDLRLLRSVKSHARNLDRTKHPLKTYACLYNIRNRLIHMRPQFQTQTNRLQSHERRPITLDLSACWKHADAIAEMIARVHSIDGTPVPEWVDDGLRVMRDKATRLAETANGFRSELHKPLTG